MSERARYWCTTAFIVGLFAVCLTVRLSPVLLGTPTVAATAVIAAAPVVPPSALPSMEPRMTSNAAGEPRPVASACLPYTAVAAGPALSGSPSHNAMP